MSSRTSPVALVTGGAVRVGRAICLGLAEAGYDVVIHYRSSSDAAAELLRRIEAKGRTGFLLQGDLSRPEDVTRMAKAVKEECGRLDLLVNSASSFQTGDLASVDVDEWDQVMAVNLRGPFLTLKAFSSDLAASGGSVVNIVDLSAFRPWVTYPHHSVSKAALLHLTKVAARTFAPHVRVNAVAPGHVLTPDDWTPEQVEASRRRVPLGRLGQPEDVVRTVRFLADSPYITGEVVLVDGGENLGR